jgi:apolipoprotein N-acyltransferase
MLLLGGGLVVTVSNGRWILPIAAWLAPVLLMRYVRTARRLWAALAGLWTVFVITTVVSWTGLWPFPLPVVATIATVGSLYSLIPYLLDRLTTARSSGVLQTLVFPSASVGVGFLGYLRSDSTWGNIAYTQTENLPLLQFASVAGIWGITFLVYWLAPVLNNLWRDGWSAREARRAAIAYAAALGAVLLFGSARLVWLVPADESLRVASVSPPDVAEIATTEQLLSFQQIMMKQPVDERTAEEVRTLFASTHEALFEETRREARAGAEIVVWPEASLLSFDSEEDAALIGRARKLASEEEIYLAMTVAMVPLDRERLNENRVLLIDPNGELLETYWKHNTVPVVEEPFAVEGSPRPLLADTDSLRLGAVICYDMDSPRYLHRARGEGIDVLLAPSGDWPAIKEIHYRMAIVRAVELGFALVRPANHGVTIAADHQGRILGRMDHYATSERRMSATVPGKGVVTVYSRTGDALPWACLAFSAGIVVRALLLAMSGWLASRRRIPSPA